MADGPTRFIGLDIHKEYFVAVGVNAQREVVFGPQRVSNYQLDDWVARVLTTQDSVVLEMTTNAYLFYDTLLPQVHSIIAVHPPNVALVTNAQVKTDKKDTLILARLLAANLVPTVWVPPEHVRELRQLVSHRRRMAGMHTYPRSGHTQVVNRMHSVAHQHHLNHLKGKSFQPKNTGWQRDESLSRLEKMQLELDMETRAHLEEQVERMTRELGRMSHKEPWASTW